MYHREPRTEREREALYGRVRKIAYWLDSFANVGGLHVGLEAIVGFIPVIGNSLANPVGRMHSTWTTTRKKKCFALKPFFSPSF